MHELYKIVATKLPVILSSGMSAWSELEQTVANLFETESLLGVLHLLNDTREVVGIGQSEFIRGACWAGPAGVWEMS